MIRTLTILFPVLAFTACAHPNSNLKSEATTTSPGTASRAKAEPIPPLREFAGATDQEQPKLDCHEARVHFEFNSAVIAEADKASLESSAACLKADNKLHITIEGNADERGTEEYNVALGDERAQSVARYLERLGASASQLKTVSYGKQNPVCSEHDEACWWKNRRAALILK
jgi:peptidoglycan-associated lipoprotein